MSTMPEYTEEQLQAARRHVSELRGLHIHVAVYGAVIGGLFVVNFVTGRPS